ncbi:MFS transporter [Sporolactobacillus vineae]|uniref:MFS transporter n=1 Tax=Sporolactobacillus vineae TaxID=444463 RepID=UPI00028A39BA|nr:MFS transporter [Sporolactobacillus vineae]
MKRYNDTLRFPALIGAVLICGTAEGMLLPLIASMLEEQGVPAIVNGAGTTALYIGMLVALPFMERPMQKLGYRTFLLVGLLLITLALFLFPLWFNLWFWFVLRLAVGIGDSMLHFAAQTWITIGSPHKKRGRNIAIYGLAFGLGFATGPLLVRLLAFGIAVPFLTAGFLCTLFLIPLVLLNNAFPDQTTRQGTRLSDSLRRYRKTTAMVWSGLTATFGYGFMEASLNNSFPVFALRNGLGMNGVAALLPAFVCGGLITQIPIGMLSDRLGRKKLLPILTLLGAVTFLVSALIPVRFSGFFFTFLAAGLLTGSLYSLSMGYVSDMLPRRLIPLGNIQMSLSYSIGCMAGPVVSNLLISVAKKGSLFFGIAGMLLIVSASVVMQQIGRSRKSCETVRVS